MSELTRLRFSLEAGIFLRRQVRLALNKLRRDVEWQEPEVIFKIEEEKGFINSTFYVEVINISAPLAISVKEGIEKFVS